jgi:hypothetical protein
MTRDRGAGGEGCGFLPRSSMPAMLRHCGTVRTFAIRRALRLCSVRDANSSFDYAQDDNNRCARDDRGRFLCCGAGIGERAKTGPPASPIAARQA